VTIGAGEVLAFLALAVILGAVGVAVGMLVLAPRLTRLVDRTEESGDRTHDD